MVTNYSRGTRIQVLRVVTRVVLDGTVLHVEVVLDTAEIAVVFEAFGQFHDCRHRRQDDVQLVVPFNSKNTHS